MLKHKIVVIYAIMLSCFVCRAINALNIDEIKLDALNKIGEFSNECSIVIRDYNKALSQQDLELINAELRERDKVLLTITDGKKRKYKVSGVLSRSFQAAVPKYDIDEGSVVKIDDFDVITAIEPLHQIDSYISEDSLKSLENSTKIAKRKLNAGNIVKISNIEVAYSVKKGNRVTLKFIKRNLLIETIGIALESGKIGDTIKVKNPETNKILIGTVVDEGAVSLK